ncbi:MAG: helix-turn-helix domain-containing protein [bacterium]|nr:helix-turn-helix domain-containing protein [bacterium]
MSEITKILTQFGLTSNQIKVYLALLELGEGKVGDIAKKAHILRPTTYEVLGQLEEVGVVNQHNRHNVRLHMAEPPIKLEKILESRKKAIHSVLPELESMYNTGGFKPKIRYYEGVEGYKTVYEDTLTVSGKRLFGILSMQDLFDTVGEKYMNDYTKCRIEKGIHLQVIRSEAKESKPIWKNSEKEFRSLRFAPEDFVFPLTMYIYDNKVSLMSSRRENFGLIIESKEFMQTQKALFDVLWRVCSRGE